MKPKILFLHSTNSSAVGYYRSRVHARALRAAGWDVTYWEEHSYHTNLKPTLEAWLEKHIGEFDIVHADRCSQFLDLGLLASYRHSSPTCRLIMDFDDDLLSIPQWNPAHKRFQQGQERLAAGLAHMKLAEMTTVATPTLATKFAPMTHRIRVIPNRIDARDWEGLPVDPDRPDDPCIRVFYGGASGHYGDLDGAFRTGITRVLSDPPVPMRLITLGALPAWLYSLGRKYPGRVVTLPWVDFSEGYAEAVAWGGFDIALAPLVEHPFNAAKSPIKWLEASLLGHAFLCSRIGPYADLPDGTAVRVPNEADAWADALRSLLLDAELRRAFRTEARTAVLEGWTVDGLAAKWQPILEEAASSPRIESLETIEPPGSQEPAGNPATLH